MFATARCGQIDTGHSAQDSIRRVGLELRTFREAWLAWSESADWSARGLPAEVQCLRLGDGCIAHLPGEAFVEVGLELRAARPDLRLFPVAYANGAPGHLPHRSAFAAGGYELDEAYSFHGLPAPYGPAVGQVLVGAMLEATAAADPKPDLPGGEH